MERCADLALAPQAFQLTFLTCWFFRTAKRWRPFRRRRRRIARPPRVDIRARKPWTRALRRIFGW